MNREPLRLIGIAASIALAIVQTLAGQGVISAVAAGHANDLIADIVGILTILAPWIAAELARPSVTPVAAPVLPIQTPVTTPSGAPAVVSGASPNMPGASSTATTA